MTCKNCDCPECQKINDENFRKYLEEASKEVNTWPEWKKNILRDSHQGYSDIPRPIVRNSHRYQDDGY